MKGETKGKLLSFQSFALQLFNMDLQHFYNLQRKTHVFFQGLEIP